VGFVCLVFLVTSAVGHVHGKRGCFWELKLEGGEWTKGVTLNDAGSGQAAPTPQSG